MEQTPEFAKQCREEAQRKYEDEKSKFGLQMMLMGYYKVKSLLSEEGLKKVGMIDQKREHDQIFNKDFSEEMWSNTEKIWGAALEELIEKISLTYGLTKGIDLKVAIDDQESEDGQLDYFA